MAEGFPKTWHHYRRLRGLLDPTTVSTSSPHTAAGCSGGLKRSQDRKMPKMPLWLQKQGWYSLQVYHFLQLAALRFLGFCGFFFFPPITVMICQSRVRGRTVKNSAKLRAHLYLKERTLSAFCHHYGDCFSSAAMADFCVPQLKRATQTEY